MRASLDVLDHALPVVQLLVALPEHARVLAHLRRAAAGRIPCRAVLVSVLAPWPAREEQGRATLGCASGREGQRSAGGGACAAPLDCPPPLPAQPPALPRPRRTSSSLLPSMSLAISPSALRPYFSQARTNALNSRRVQLLNPSLSSASRSALWGAAGASGGALSLPWECGLAAAVGYATTSSLHAAARKGPTHPPSHPPPPPTLQLLLAERLRVVGLRREHLLGDHLVARALRPRRRLLLRQRVLMQLRRVLLLVQLRQPAHVEELEVLRGAGERRRGRRGQGRGEGGQLSGRGGGHSGPARRAARSWRLSQGCDQRQKVTQHSVRPALPKAQPASPRPAPGAPGPTHTCSCGILDRRGPVERGPYSRLAMACGIMRVPCGPSAPNLRIGRLRRFRSAERALLEGQLRSAGAAHLPVELVLRVAH